MEIRNPSEEELRAAMRVTESAFGEEQKDEDFERHRKMLPRDRFFAANDRSEQLPRFRSGWRCRAVSSRRAV